MSEVTNGLRELADFLDAHADVVLSAPNYLVYVGTRDQIAALARIGGWRKVYDDNWFHLVRGFSGGIELTVYTNRSEVCRKIVTGQKTVPAIEEHTVETFEWVCEEESLLAGAK